MLPNSEPFGLPAAPDLPGTRTYNPPMADFHVKRCFVAIELDEIARADLGDSMDRIDIDGLRLGNPQNLHVTLKFLGDVEDPALPGVIERLRHAAAGIGPIELNATGIAYLPDARRARVLSATVDSPPELLQLFHRVEDAMADAGFRREGRPYRPHITIGRFRKPPRRAPAPQTLPFGPTSWTAEAITLMQSDLGPGGPTYTPLAEMRLGEKPEIRSPKSE